MLRLERLGNGVVQLDTAGLDGRRGKSVAVGRNGDLPPVAGEDTPALDRIHATLALQRLDRLLDSGTGDIKALHQLSMCGQSLPHRDVAALDFMTQRIGHALILASDPADSAIARHILKRTTRPLTS
ncbi:hypothetical protein PV350_19420 [Streptomyces sp. PA03-6a]|nr:hypothetical protein [Streptomyces sp. PA03-6a]